MRSHVYIFIESIDCFCRGKSCGVNIHVLYVSVKLISRRQSENRQPTAEQSGSIKMVDPFR